jgi:hypothetical protein
MALRAESEKAAGNGQKAANLKGVSFFISMDYAPGHIPT